MYYNELLSLLGERIRALRKEKNIKQEKLAELVDKTTEHISFIERGERAPSLELLLNLAQILNVSLPYLLDVTATEQYSTESIPAPVPSDSLPESVKEPVIPEEKRRSAFERMQDAFEKVQELQKLAKEYGIADIFQDNGDEYELKTVNYALTTQVSTHHHLNKEILDKYRKVKAWYFAIYEDIELREVWKVPPSQLEELFQRWEAVIEQTGKELNNPKIPLWFVQTRGECVYRNPNKPSVPRAKKPKLIKEREAQYAQEAQLHFSDFE